MGIKGPQNDCWSYTKVGNLNRGHDFLPYSKCQKFFPLPCKCIGPLFGPGLSLIWGGWKAASRRKEGHFPLVDDRKIVPSLHLPFKGSPKGERGIRLLLRESPLLPPLPILVLPSEAVVKDFPCFRFKCGRGVCYMFTMTSYETETEEQKISVRLTVMSG